MFSNQKVLSGSTQAHLFHQGLISRESQAGSFTLKVQWVETLLVSWLYKPHGACIGLPSMRIGLQPIDWLNSQRFPNART